MRVGFLFNHYFTHQIAPAVPCAFELSRKNPDLDVIIAYSSEQELSLVETIAEKGAGLCLAHHIYTMSMASVSSRWSSTISPTDWSISECFWKYTQQVLLV
ncbi:MAG: hypothetical protein ACI8ZB_004189 [Desulforhopalus sp.]|jgi:hypothetical protein